jgi:DNA primase catalytic subunit
MYHRGSTKSFRVKRWEGAGSLKTLYKAYYSATTRLKPPSDIQMREFAFQPFETESYIRHMSFKDFNELRGYLEANAPRHAYYSIALYQLPDARSMEEKGWLGSEILVDVDVDRLRGCRELKLEEGVELVDDNCLMEGFKAALRVKRMLYKDLGVDSRVYFSGSRGFHVLGYCEYCLTLGREERGEIASYIAGLDLSLGHIIPLRPLEEGVELVDDNCLMEGFKAALRVKRMLYRDLGVDSRVYFSGSRGFHVLGYCEYCLTLGREERGEIASYIAGLDLSLGHIIPLRPRKGVPATPTAEDPGWRGLIGEQLELKGVSRTLEVEEGVLESIVEELKVPVDMQVTKDPSRLARLIGSVNGKSSLLVVEVEGDSFKPTLELSPFRGEVTVKARLDLGEVELLGLRVGFKRGEVLDLEAPVAILLASKNIVTPLSGEVWVEH